MSGHDPRPLPESPATYRIREKANNRLGAGYHPASGLPDTILSPRGNKQSAHDVMHTAYIIILFGDTTKNAVDSVLNDRAEGGTNFTAAIQASQAITIDNWNTKSDETEQVTVDRGRRETQYSSGLLELCHGPIRCHRMHEADGMGS
ncbi:hypothetical protein EDB87DRAFT_1824164 [Lactarius vividus]|nr:hypothetical protein EDB87DRAFT_1824164 [Lactarius vividus]